MASTQELRPLLLSLFVSGFPTAPGLQSNQRPLINCSSPAAPADLFQSLPVMVNPCQARGFWSSEAEALGLDIRNSWAWMADAACVWAVVGGCWEHRELKCRLINVIMENCSKIHFDSLSLGLNATAYYAKMFFPFPLTWRFPFKSKSMLCLFICKWSCYHSAFLDCTIWGCAVSLVLVSSQKNLSFEFLRFVFPTPYHLCPSFSFKERNGYIVLILCAWLNYKLLKQAGYTYLLFGKKISLLL